MSEVQEAVALTPPSSNEGEGGAAEAETASTPPSRPKLNHKNWINLASLVLNMALVYGVGNAGWADTPDNGELSRKYQTLVTPKSSAFSIWAVIFTAQIAWSIVQMLPKFRASPMVQDIGYWYASVAATQIGWTFSFGFEVIPLSLAFMLAIWISLITILYRQYYSASDGTIVEFWALRFPFAIHAGWITAASALNVGVQVVSMDQPAAVQLAVSIVSLAVLHAVSVWVLFNIPRPNWTMACVLAWAFGWIYAELGSPNEKITGTFAEETIWGVRYAAIAVCFIILFQLALRLALLVRPSYNPYKKVDEDQPTYPSCDMNDRV